MQKLLATHLKRLIENNVICDIIHLSITETQKVQIMSRGKYSPNANAGDDCFIFNCLKQIPSKWFPTIVYDEKTMFDAYDSEGFDRYGYSAFDSGGNYVGVGMGIDRLGNTELDYLSMTDEEFNCL